MRRIHVLQRGVCFVLIAGVVIVAADDLRAADSAVEPEAVHAVLKANCFSCHGEKKQKGKLRLDTLSMAPESEADLSTWRRVFEQIMDEEMPPEDEKQPSRDEREKVLAWVKDTLAANSSSFNLTPSQANYVDHEALFSGKPAGDPATPARVWRLAGKSYEAFMHRLGKELGLNLPSPRERAIRAPWGRDGYSTAGRIDEAEIESHLRTCALLLSRILPLVKKNTFRIRSLHPVYKAGKDATAAQIQAAVKESFGKILRLTPDPSEMQEFSKLLTDDLKTYEPLRAVERFLTRVLSHPVVLYRVETPIAGSQRSIMPPRQLARAIAYSLTYSEPDEGLRKALAAGKLSTKEGVRREVQRLVYATAPYGQEVKLTADQLAKMDALNREHWNKSAEARKAVNYNHKLRKVLTPDQAARWIRLQKSGYRSMDGEQINLTARLRPRVMSFFQKYFGYTSQPFKCNVTLKELNVPKNSNQNWTSGSFRKDTDRLVDWVLESDKEVLRTLLTTRKTFVVARRTGHPTQGFRRHTGQIGEALKWKEFQCAVQTYEISLTPEQWLLGPEEPIDMPKGHRMGILTHPSWLVAKSGNFDNDAIHRGKWIHEKLLGGRIPDVPITVDAKLPDEPHNTLRERMRATSAERCIKCHNRMDPLGLTFEQFDHFGRYRTAEIVVDKEKTAQLKNRDANTPRVMTTKPFETSGEIVASGDPALDGPVSDAFELIEKLAHSERVEQVFVRYVFRYFMGRNETLADGPTLVAAHTAYRENGGSFKALLVSLLTSDSFLYRTASNSGRIANPSAPGDSSGKANPRIVKSRDPELDKEFEYLVYDLGQGVELKLVKVSAGGKTFSIGSSVKEQDAVVQKYFHGKRPSHLDFEADHTITLTDDFYIGQCEVTRGQFRRFVEDTGYRTETERTDGGYGWNEKLRKFEGRDRKYSWKNYGVSSETDDYPVTNITRNDARKFCEWLAKKGDGKIRLREVRLPGEAEWEFACRAGSPRRFSFGDEEQRLTEFANIADATWAKTFAKSSVIRTRDGHAFSAPVGQFKPNAFGLYDMHGNVWEWCDDYYGKYSALPKQRNAIQTVNQGQKRPVMRGGAWYIGPKASRCANRWLVGIGGRYGSGGFRIVCMP